MSSELRRIWIGCLSWLWAATWAGQAQAQELGAEARAAPESPAETAAVQSARELTARARERFEANDFAAALLEFTRAYELMAPGDPRRAALLNNVAVCHERMFRYDLAVASYQRYLDEGEPAPEDRAEVEAVIRGLRQLLGKLHVTTNVRAEVWVDGRALGMAPGDFQVPAGARVIELRAAGHQISRRSLEVAARSLTSAHFELEPLPSYHGIDRRYFWSGVALTGAALVTGAGLGGRALRLYREAEELDEAGLLKPGDQDKIDNLKLAADIAFGTAALFAVSSTVLAFMTDFRGSKEQERAPAPAPAASGARLRFEPRVGRGALMLRVSGAWP